MKCACWWNMKKLDRSARAIVEEDRDAAGIVEEDRDAAGVPGCRLRKEGELGIGVLVQQLFYHYGKHGVGV